MTRCSVGRPSAIALLGFSVLLAPMTASASLVSKFTYEITGGTKTINFDLTLDGGTYTVNTDGITVVSGNIINNSGTTALNVGDSGGQSSLDTSSGDAAATDITYGGGTWTPLAKALPAIRP